MWSVGYVNTAQVFALIGLIVLAVGFATNNWLEHYVDRDGLQELILKNSTLEYDLVSFNTSEIFFSRALGLFQKCFMDEVPFSCTALVFLSSNIAALNTFVLDMTEECNNSQTKCFWLEEKSVLPVEDYNSDNNKLIHARQGTALKNT